MSSKVKDTEIILMNDDATKKLGMYVLEYRIVLTNFLDIIWTIDAGFYDIPF